MSLYLLSQINNAICILACIICFFHALHSGIRTSLLSKLLLFMVGISFYSSVLNADTLLIPGHRYVMIFNIAFGLTMITVFTIEAYRSGYLTLWIRTFYQSKHKILPTGGEYGKGRKH